MCGHMNQGICRGLWGGGGPSRNTEKPDLQGSCSIPKHSSSSDRSKQNFSKNNTLFV